MIIIVIVVNPLLIIIKNLKKKICAIYLQIQFVNLIYFVNKSTSIVEI